MCRNRDVDPGIKRCLVARRELRRASNEGTLRAFRYADRFPTFKIFRRPGSLRRHLAPGQEGSESLRPFLRMIFANSKDMFERISKLFERYQ
jgi:hypothetical protein